MITNSKAQSPHETHGHDKSSSSQPCGNKGLESVDLLIAVNSKNPIFVIKKSLFFNVAQRFNIIFGSNKTSWKQQRTWELSLVKGQIFLFKPLGLPPPKWIPILRQPKTQQSAHHLPSCLLKLGIPGILSLRTLPYTPTGWTLCAWIIPQQSYYVFKRPP